MCILNKTIYIPCVYIYCIYVYTLGHPMLVQFCHGKKLPEHKELALYVCSICTFSELGWSLQIKTFEIL